MTDRLCLVCGGRFTQARIAGLLSCTTCGFVSADMTLTHEELSRIYSAHYFHGKEYRDYQSERAVIELQGRRRLQALLELVPEAESKSLYEIGAAYGYFLTVAATAFARVEGIDISADAADAARASTGVKVEEGDFLCVEAAGPFDVVCLWDTIEHLSRPDLYLSKVAAHMPAGGLVAISTADISSAVARLRGSKWRQIHPPTHLHYFSRQTLTRLLDVHGFDVRSVEYDGFYRSVDTMAFIILTIKHRREGLYRRLKKAGLLDWNLYLNLYDTMTVMATRR